ncbi:MAG: LysM peptidoglycan-binding domain-containing protein [Chloroflexi bacterium]|nr:LysM peptidoglycan-binding domain-containing protein [Chloroflexota bacterium]
MDKAIAKRPGRRFWSVVFLTLLTAACNLTRTAPLPLQTPLPATLAFTGVNRTLFPSITPIDLNPPTLGAPTLASSGDCPAPPQGWIPYVVQEGDTLGDLALTTGMPTSELARVNCLIEPNALFAGQTLFLPLEPVG